MDAWVRDAKWRLLVIAVLVFAMYGLKRHYAAAPVEMLGWIMAPTAKLVTSVSGLPFELEPGAGYINRDHMFSIAKPCAGINFMVAAIGMLGFLTFSRARSLRSAAAVIAVSLLAAYAVAVLVNAARILFAIELSGYHVTSSFWTAARLHRAEGIVMYFGGLLLLQLCTTRALGALDRR
jgi:exosortase K